MRTSAPLMICLAVAVATASLNSHRQPPAGHGRQIDPPELPRQFKRIQDIGGFQPQLVEVRRFIRADEAHVAFNVDGTGLTAAVFDTGLRATHADFGGGTRVPVQKNFTPEGVSVPLAPDKQGHGTNVAGIIGANGFNRGIAPGANLIPVKVLNDKGEGDFTWVDDGLQWVLDNHQVQNISVVNLSLGSPTNEKSDDQFADTRTRKLIQQLRTRGVAVVVASGNSYFKEQSEGMAFPAIIRETISVGAVYDADGGKVTYPASKSVANSRAAGRITPFSQRLFAIGAASEPAPIRTDVLAPGAPVTSTGIKNDSSAVSTQHGTSQAAPVTTGVILLLQQYYMREAHSTKLPAVDLLERWLRDGGIAIKDGDDEDDNVKHTGRTFLRLDAMKALEQARLSAQQTSQHANR